MCQSKHIQSAPFIVGVGRSGTTLLRLMLDSHPHLSIPPETHFIRKLLNSSYSQCDENFFFNTVVSTRTWKDFGIEETELYNRLITIPEFSISDGLRVFYTCYAEKNNKILWGDKTPIYLSNMTEIQRILPESFFIHIIRDGRDSAISYRGLWFGPGNSVLAHAKMWSDRIYEGRMQAKNLNRKYFEIRYERLVAEPEKVLKEICDLLALNYCDDMLNYHLSAKDRISQMQSRISAKGEYIAKERIHNMFDLTSTPPDKRRIGRWRKEMSREELMLYESEAGPLLHNLGYETNFPELWKK